MAVTLIADSGATKVRMVFAGWRYTTKQLLLPRASILIFYRKDRLLIYLKKNCCPGLTAVPETIFFYGSGLGNEDNAKTIRAVLKHLFSKTSLHIDTDILAAARAACGSRKGMVCILGTGSNTCYYNGRRIAKNIAGIGYILGDEGSGAYLGKKVVQHYLYNTFDEDLQARFDAMFVTTRKNILENVYSKPLPNRYLASFATFLAQNRGHYIVENILEDGLNDFFFQHLCKFKESWTLPIHFAGGVAFGFQDVLKQLCESYKWELGSILQNPMPGLINFHHK